MATFFCILWISAIGNRIAYAQDARNITGVVVDANGEPLAGASVVVYGKNSGTIADTNGKFVIRVNPGEKLQFDFLGFETKLVTVGSAKNLNVVLEPSRSNTLDEVVVIGYGQVAKRDLTGSVAVVKMNDIQDAPAMSVDNALQGRIAGADFLTTSGEPGATTSIRIRGTRSINAS